MDMGSVTKIRLIFVSDTHFLKTVKDHQKVTITNGAKFARLIRATVILHTTNNEACSHRERA